MLRTQIQLTEEEHRKLRQAAQREGVSMAEIVRRCIGRYFREEAPDREALYARAASVVGKFRDRDGAKDVSDQHDEYLDEAYS